MELAVSYPHIFALRYPRGSVPASYDSLPKRSFEIGEGEILREGNDVTLLALGTMVEVALKAHDFLKQENIDARVINMRFAKPLDAKMICMAIERSQLAFTLEEHVLTGGFGAQVLEWLEKNHYSKALVKRLALPDEFIEHGSREAMLDQFGLSAEKVAKRVRSELREKRSGNFGQAGVLHAGPDFLENRS